MSHMSKADFASELPGLEPFFVPRVTVEMENIYNA